MIFISYRREDSKAIAGRIHDHLRYEFGDLAIYRDVESIPGGADFGLHIRRALANCEVCVAVIGKSWLSVRLQEPTDWVRLELEAAFSLGATVIPVLVEGASLPAVDRLPSSLRTLCSRNVVRIDSGSEFSMQVARLSDAVRLGRTGAPWRQVSQPAQASSPAIAAKILSQIESELQSSEASPKYLTEKLFGISLSTRDWEQAKRGELQLSERFAVTAEEYRELATIAYNWSESGKSRAARTAFDAFATVWSDVQYFHFMHGVVLAREHLREEAIAAYSRAIALRPTTAALTNRGELHLQVCRFEMAFSDLKGAMSLDPTGADPFALRARMLCRATAEIIKVVVERGERDPSD